ncbi:MAG: lipopolysaccharide assembly protein LapB [Gammaproteobacteria bacterium]|nr:lipopolysaccharide assembly protein LapB [Gammaproteobacteria bacterium]
MPELLLLLLPVAWYFGYRVGLRALNEKRASGQSPTLRNYFVGLNYLLNEQPDKAIDTFVEMLTVDSETVETHLALGNLFRRRGETDRAIRIHQNLIARPSLAADHRKLALLELGQDYLSAGWFDRAESIFQELLSDPKHKLTSSRQLLTIYQQMGDWPQAIQVAEQLQAATGQSQIEMIAHFHCEMAEAALAANNLKSAQQSLKKAMSLNGQFVRGSLLSAELAFASGDYRETLKAYRRLKPEDIPYLAEAVGRIDACFDQLKDPKAKIEFLRECVEQGAGVTVLLALAEAVRTQDGDKAAGLLIMEQLRRRPSLRGLYRLVELFIANSDNKTRDYLEMLGDIMSTLIAKRPIYRCSSCGFAGKTLYWHCPSCKSWGTHKPIQGLEGE